MSWRCTGCGRLSTDAANTCRWCWAEKTPEQAQEFKARARAEGKGNWVVPVSILIAVLVAIGLRVGLMLVPADIAEIPKSYGIPATYMDRDHLEELKKRGYTDYAKGSTITYDANNVPRNYAEQHPELGLLVPIFGGVATLAIMIRLFYWLAS